MLKSLKSKEIPFIPSDAGGRDYYFIYSMTTEHGIPSVCVLKDFSSQIYLCVCLEKTNVQRWIMGKTNINTLRKVRHRDITLCNALTAVSNELIMVKKDLDNNIFKHKIVEGMENVKTEYVPPMNTHLYEKVMIC